MLIYSLVYICICPQRACNHFSLVIHSHSCENGLEYFFFIQLSFKLILASISQQLKQVCLIGCGDRRMEPLVYHLVLYVNSINVPTLVMTLPLNSYSPKCIRTLKPMIGFFSKMLVFNSCAYSFLQSIVCLISTPPQKVVSVQKHWCCSTSVWFPLHDQLAATGTRTSLYWRDIILLKH